MKSVVIWALALLASLVMISANIVFYWGEWDTESRIKFIITVMLNAVFYYVYLSIMTKQNNDHVSGTVKQNIATKSRSRLCWFVYTIIFCLAQLVPNFLLSGDLSLFLFILCPLIVIRLVALSYGSNLLKLLLNILRFVIILVLAYVKYENIDFYNLEYVDRAILASIIFDTIISTSGFEKRNDRNTTRDNRQAMDT